MMPLNSKCVNKNIKRQQQRRQDNDNDNDDDNNNKDKERVASVYNGRSDVWQPVSRFGLAVGR